MHALRYLFILMLAGTSVIHAQIIVTDPALPTPNMPMTVYFDATRGTGGLMDYAGDVYAHTGVLTRSSTSGGDWKYVKTDWGVNTPETKMTREADNLYSLQITPSIREYYGVPSSDTITNLAFVFRSADASLEGKETGGKDIFAEVFGEGLQIKVISPSRPFRIVERNEVLNLVIEAAGADTMAVYLDDTFLEGTGPANELSFGLPTESYGDFMVEIWASGQQEEFRDTLFYTVRRDPLTKTLPEGITDGITVQSDTSVILSLFAPNKEYVYVLGDFSKWVPSEAFYMNRTPDGDRFWLSVGNLDPGELYRFTYLVDGELNIPDPNTHLLVDPSNDRYISESTYPGITLLRLGLPEGLFSVIETVPSSFTWEIQSFDPPPAEELVIYELLLRDFLAAHDWKTLTDTLDYLDALGINAIELMPFNEFSGNESWGYNPTFWICTDKYYGPREDLKRFVDECHARGIAVIQDIVFNHAEGRSSYSKLYAEPNGYPSDDNPWLNPDVDPDDPKGWYQACHPYNVFYDFNHSSEYTQQMVDRTTRYWMEEYRVDGFRFDLSKGFTQKNTYLGTDSNGNARYNESATAAYDGERISYLKRMADSIWAFNKKSYVILEHFCDNTEEKELSDYGMMLWGNMNYNYGEAVMGYHDNGKSDFSWISYKKRGWNDPHLVGYMESHDEERLMYKMQTYGKVADGYSVKDLNTALERMELAGAFFFTVPGPKMIWQFGELGYDYSIDYDCRICNKPIRWDYNETGRRKKLYQVWSALIHLRREQLAFISSDFTLDVSEAVKRIEINHPQMDVRIIGNFDVSGHTADPSFNRTGWWYDYFSGDSLQVSDLHGELFLDPGQFRIYTSSRLNKPEITAKVIQHVSPPARFRIYPNPVADFFHMDPLPENVVISIYEPGGKCLLQSEMKAGEDRLDVSMLPAGFYIVTRADENQHVAYSSMVKHSP